LGRRTAWMRDTSNFSYLSVQSHESKQVNPAKSSAKIPFSRHRHCRLLYAALAFDFNENFSVFSPVKCCLSTTTAIKIRNRRPVSATGVARRPGFGRIRIRRQISYLTTTTTINVRRSLPHLGRKIVAESSPVQRCQRLQAPPWPLLRPKSMRSTWTSSLWPVVVLIRIFCIIGEISMHSVSIQL